ncbi:hypothetical protein PMZ80_006879 [Knufia obscura]|uniref:Mechanosensitive ion channel protein n=2 Tax=Knufia TaxID=430999 RepID=A0AAN8EZS6_9EURO|nr:hypothetical protein PMZ80_006879 [Knufia obscura]KAK5957421.1 hypothetical protein OHC33_001795 [Knufia fluminis]
MATPNNEPSRPDASPMNRSSDEERTVVGHSDNGLRKDDGGSVEPNVLRDRLKYEQTFGADLNERFETGSSHKPSASRVREEMSRLNDDLALEKAEKVISRQMNEEDEAALHRSRSRKPEPIDDFDAATNPIHERTQVYKPPEHPTNKFAAFFKYIHQSWWVLRYFTYIVPVFALLLIPVLMGALLPAGQAAAVGGVELLWFGVWLEIIWLTLWAGRIIAKCIPWPLGLVSSLFTNNAKKWRDLGKQLELPATLFFWWLGVLISFLPTMTNHHTNGRRDRHDWETTLNKIIVAVFVLATCNFIEKLIIQLIAISFHLRTYADRIEINKFQIGSLTKLYVFSKAQIAMDDTDFEEKGPASGARTPGVYADQAQHAITKAFAKVGDVAGTVAGDFTGKQVAKSGHPSQVVLALLSTNAGSQILARRLYRTFVREDFETVFSGDLKPAFENDDEADAAFSMFDKDLNGDISMEELEAVCVEIGRERKAITASLKDLDSVVSKLDDVLFTIVVIIFILVLISLLSTSAAGVLTSAGSTVLALSWLFSATAQEFLQSIIFVFVKHPFDVGDRVSIYGNTGAKLQGDDYFVKEIALLYTEFKKMEGQIVQAPNSYLNTLFILNMRRSGGLAEAVPIVIRFGTTIEQIEGLRQALIEFVLAEKREYQGKILTELREVTEAYSLTLNVVFFYKSNWQNELLRLQRRNKFICALMTSMQSLGIEGPRRNNAGWRTDIPMYLHNGGGAPPAYGQPPNPENSNPPAAHEGHDMHPVNTHQSILRRPSTGQLGRPRHESASHMNKRVDFSLGMKDMSTADFLGEDDDERSASRYREVIREANEAEEKEKSRAGSVARSTSRELHRQSHEQSPQMSGGIFRRSTGLSTTGGRARGESISSQATHKNRFLSRLGHPVRSLDMPRDSLAEEGHAGPSHIDPRTGNVSNQAVRVDTATDRQMTQQFPPAPTSLEPIRSRDFELNRLQSRPT